MKRYWMIGTLAAALGSAGCGGNGAGGDVVRLWAHEGQPAEKAALTELCDRFNRSHDDVKVEVAFKQEQGYGERVNAAALAGGLPDILDVDGPFTARFADAGILAPLAGMFTDAELADFLPTVIAQGTWRDTLYTLGSFESTVVLFYNRTVADACGITPPGNVADAWTWDAFRTALRTVKRKRPDLLPLETFMPWGGEWLTYAFTPVIWSNGGALLAPDGKKAAGYADGAPAVAALRAWQRLFTEKLTSTDTPPGQFRQGRAAFAWGVFNRWPLYREAGLDFGMAPLPRFKEPASPSGSWCWGVTGACRNRDKARTVLRWLVDVREGIPALTEANGGIPARRSAVAADTSYRKTRGLFIEQLEHGGRARPVTPRYGTVTNEVSRALNDIALGGDPATVMKKTAADIDRVLAAD